LHFKLSKPFEKWPSASVWLANAHAGVAVAGAAVDTASVTTAGAMRTRSIRILQWVSRFIVVPFFGFVVWLPPW